MVAADMSRSRHAGARHATPPATALPPPVELTVLYDERCELCIRARDWLRSQQLHVPMELLAAGSPEARRRYGDVPWRGQELIVAAPDGRVWVGASAFLMCLWATRRYRHWAYRLSSPTLAPLARRFFTGLSARRSSIGALLGPPPCRDCEHLPHGVQGGHP